MYKIMTLDGAKIVTVDKIQHVKVQQNGIIITCEPKLAQGILAGDAIYHLEGLPPLEGYETVTYEESDGVADLAAYQEALAEMGVTI